MLISVFLAGCEVEHKCDVVDNKTLEKYAKQCVDVSLDYYNQAQEECTVKLNATWVNASQQCQVLNAQYYQQAQADIINLVVKEGYITFVLPNNQTLTLVPVKQQSK